MPDTTTNEIAKASPDMREQRIEQLKALLPDLFDGEGQLDEKSLRALISNEAGVSAERFSFEWAGKQKSKRLAFTPSRATLAYDAARSLNSDGTENKAGQTAAENTSENLIIEGDNLEVLKLLQATYFEQVKCIYIDPPYNTGNDFIYPDNFTEGKKAYWGKNGTIKEGVKLTALPESHGRRHSDWLNFMQPRLLLARQMLREDGVICVSIDDNEAHNLRKLMDEVFGEKNFISEIAVVNNPRGRQSDSFIANVHDTLLIFGKNTDETSLLGDELSETQKKDYKYNDENGECYRLLGLRQRGSESNRADRPDMFFPIYVNPKNEAVSFDKQDGFLEVLPKKSTGAEGRWMWGAVKCKTDKNRLIAKLITTRNEYDIFVKDYLNKNGIERKSKFKSVWTDKEYNNQQGTQEIKQMFNSAVMSFPKSKMFIESILQMCTENSDILIDFFAGSGTTAHAAMQRNIHDGANRKHIMVQIPELTNEKTEAYKAGYKKISDITIERVKRAGAKIREENPDAEIDTGFRVFKLTHSNFAENLFTPDEDKSDAENVQALEAHLAEAAQIRLFDADEFNNLVTEISLKNGFGLFYQLEAIADFEHNKIYRLHGNGKSALLCLDNNLHDASVESLKPFNEEQLIVSKSALDTSKKFSLQTEFKDNLWVV